MVRKKLFLGLEIVQRYKNRIKKDFNVTAERLDFRDQGLTVRTVNNFVSEATRQMIPNMLPGDFHRPDMRAFLVNAVYFKGQRATCFDPGFTHEDTFHGINGDRKEFFMAKHPFKHCHCTFAYGTSVLSLPYEEDKEYEFVIFLPRKKGKFEKFRANLTGAIMKKLVEIAREETESMNVTIPKFKITSDPPMKEMLQQLGIVQLFESGCDLRGVCETEHLFVDDVIHKAVVEVDEEGRELDPVAAKGKGMIFTLPNIYPVFQADHLFVYGVFRGSKSILVR
ncbi:hypothetical protein Aduo_016441 [Ancylostoma duodenale]